MHSKWAKRLASSMLALAVWIGTQQLARAVASPPFSAGFASTCAIKGDGSLWCWGRNFDGELGIGSSASQQVMPVLVASLGNNVVEVAAGDTKTCARKSDGTLWCWGASYVGDG